MEITAEEKKDIETKIVDTIIAALEQDALASDEVPVISSYVLERIDTVKTHEELMIFLRELSAKWALFTKLLVMKSGEAQLQSEAELTKSVEELAKGGNIDDALKLIKEAAQAKVE